MSKLELTSLNCTNCGASLHGYEGKNEIQCEYCNTRIKVLRPRSVSVTQGNLSTDNYDRLNNYVQWSELPKVNTTDNTITIKKVKDSWTRDEVRELLHKARFIEYSTNSSKNTEILDKWIEENL